DNTRLDTTDQLNNASSGGGGFNTRVTFTEPVSEFSRLQANYRFRNTSRYAEREAYDYLAATGQYDLLNMDLSNRFRNDYLYQEAGMEYQFRKDDFLLELGADYQLADSRNHQLFPEEEKARRSFHSVLPEASLRYNLSKDRRLRFSYETDTDPPSIRDLQDVIDNSSPLNIRAGNPDLKQEFRHDLSLEYSSVDRETSRHFSASFSADIASNQIVSSEFIAREDSLIAEGIVLGKGARFSRPENVNGYYSLRSHISYGIPVEALKLNVNLNTGLRHVHDVGLQNRAAIYSDSYGFHQGVSVYSNINENVEFGLRTRINYNIVRNSREGELNYNYFSQDISADASYIFWKGLHLASNIGYRYNRGLSAGYDQGYLIWNAFIGKKILKQQNAEITLSAYDLLNNNTSIDRNVNERYVEDTQTNILKQYFLLSFSYHLRKFGLHN
ncbi:MAG TPA: TonB-dependent receptor, partial [Anseongella sp.]|nr:TonB-dependent receptor [Anseongella sp.]